MPDLDYHRSTRGPAAFWKGIVVRQRARLGPTNQISRRRADNCCPGASRRVDHLIILVPGTFVNARAEVPWANPAGAPTGFMREDGHAARESYSRAEHRGWPTHARAKTITFAIHASKKTMANRIREAQTQANEIGPHSNNCTKI